MDTRFTTQKECRAIKQAIKLFEENATISKYKSKGWTQNKQGAFKKVFIKDGVVTKIGPMDQMISEELRWKKAKKINKKYLARVFGRIDNMLIQRKVKVCNKAWACREAAKIAKKLKLQDWGRNHGHTDDAPIFFDCSITKKMREEGGVYYGSYY